MYGKPTTMQPALMEFLSICSISSNNAIMGCTFMCNKLTTVSNDAVKNEAAGGEPFIDVVG